MRKFRIGDLVREGGPKGPISKIIDIRCGLYIVKSLDGMATGWFTPDILYPVKQKERYEQLSLF